MLETFRKQSKSIVIYVFFGIIIAVFVINFGPQSQGCTTSDSYAASVRREKLTENDFRYGLVLSGASRVPPAEAKMRRIREFVMDKLLEREVLASESEKLGLAVSDEEVHKLIETGSVIGLGQRQDLKGWFFNDDEAFDYERFRRFCVHEIGITVKRFIEHQKRELLAEKMREMLKQSVRVSDDEVKDDWVDRQLQVNLEYVRISPRKLASEIVVEPAEVDAYLAKNQEKVAERYNTRKFLYTKLPKEARLSYVKIVTPAVATPQPETPTAAPPAQPAPAPATHELTKARARAKQVAERLRTDDFAAVARAESGDQASRSRGGDLGWRRRGATGLGDEIEKQIFEAKPGDVIGPVENAAGIHIVKVVSFREGDQTLEQVKRDLAEELVREQKTLEIAKAKAEELLAKLRAGAKWEELFPPAKTDGGENELDAPHDDERPPSQDAKVAAEPTPAAANVKAKKGKDAVAAAPSGFERHETGFFARRGDIVPGIGVAKDIMRDAFTLTVDKPLAEKPYEAAGNVYLIRLNERRDPDMADFSKRKDEILQTYAQEKAQQLVTQVSFQLCKEAKPNVNHALLAYEDGSDDSYQPCSTLEAR